MASRPKKIEEPPRGTPSYMVSFGDMMTLMLTFFILLCTFAKKREAGFIAAGVGSFRRAINSFGLPGILPTDTDSLRLQFQRNMSKFNKKYPLFLQDWEEVQEDQINLNLERLKASVQEYLGRRSEVWLSIPITFEKNDASLKEEHRTFFRKTAPLLRAGKWSITIEGFSEGDEQPDPWEISLRRAISAAQFLSKEGEIDMHRLIPMGMGPCHPIAEEESSMENRRVGLRISKKM